MPSSDPVPLRRYRGVLVWIDRDASRVRQGRIDRAILRGQGLKIEFTCEGKAYDVTLRPSGDHVFEGTWTQGLGTKQASGEARCSLSSCGVFFGEPDGEHLAFAPGPVLQTASVEYDPDGLVERETSRHMGGRHLADAVPHRRVGLHAQ